MRLISALIAKGRGAFLAGTVFVAALPASAQNTNHPSGRPDFSAFKLVTDRNIFDPTRRGAYVRPTRESRPSRSSRVEYVALVGTMNYEEKGPLAFFDGTKSEYRKVLKPGETIAGYKVKEVAPTFVKLVSPTNELQLPVGMQLRREDDGKWQIAETSYTANDRPDRSSSSYRSTVPPAITASGVPPFSTNGEPDAATLDPNSEPMTADSQADLTDTNAPPGAPAAGGETDPVLLRLMQRRAQEINR